MKKLIDIVLLTSALLVLILSYQEPCYDNNNINCKSCINKSYCCRIYKTIWTIDLPCCLEITDELKRKNHIIYEIKKPKLKYKFRFSQ